MVKHYKDYMYVESNNHPSVSGETITHNKVKLKEI